MYRPDLAFVHKTAYGFHADRCAPWILEQLAPVLERGGTVVEIGCGAGALTRHLLAAGHQVIATDASDAMVDLTREALPDVDVRRVAVPFDDLPRGDAVVSTGHVLNYHPTVDLVEQSLRAAAAAVLPGGVLVLDLCTPEYALARRDPAPHAHVAGDWAMIAQFDIPDDETFVRNITTFRQNDDGSWRRDDEQHVNALIAREAVTAALGESGLVDVVMTQTVGGFTLPAGMVMVRATRPA